MINLFIKLLYKIISIIDHLDYNESDEKLVESYSLDNIDILTDTGFKPLSYAHLTKPFQIYNLVLEDGYHLTCADTHIVFDTKFNEVFVKDIQPGDTLGKLSKKYNVGLNKIYKLNPGIKPNKLINRQK